MGTNSTGATASKPSDDELGVKLQRDASTAQAKREAIKRAERLLSAWIAVRSYKIIVDNPGADLFDPAIGRRYWSELETRLAELGQAIKADGHAEFFRLIPKGSGARHLAIEVLLAEIDGDSERALGRLLSWMPPEKRDPLGIGDSVQEEAEMWLRVGLMEELQANLWGSPVVLLWSGGEEFEKVAAEKQIVALAKELCGMTRRGVESDDDQEKWAITRDAFISAARQANQSQWLDRWVADGDVTAEWASAVLGAERRLCRPCSCPGKIDPDKSDLLELLKVVCGDEKPPALMPRLVVDVPKLVAIFDGKQFDLKGEKQAQWLKVLADNPMVWISGPSMKYHNPDLDGIRADRLYNSLPPKLKRAVDSSTRNGHRFRLA